MPVDSPQVANAEMTSNSTWSRVSPVMASRSSEATSTSVAETSETAIATCSASRGIRRPYASTSLSPRPSARIARSMTASVVTLMPPAVDAEPPPTNMSASLSSQVPSCISPTSTVEKPPERGMTPANRDASVVALGPSGLNVSGLVHSNAATRTDPDDHEREARGDRELGVQAPPPRLAQVPGDVEDHGEAERADEDADDDRHQHPPVGHERVEAVRRRARSRRC